MNKKAISIVADWIVELILLGLTIAIFITVVINLQDNHLHSLRVEAKEYAFTRDTIFTTPYPLNYNFSLMENITLEINSNNCIIQTKYIGEYGSPVTFPCAKTSSQLITEQISKDSIRILKNE